jgi:uncharacterized membrane protein
MRTSTPYALPDASAVTRIWALAFAAAAALIPVLAFFGREEGALRNAQYPLSVLALTAIYLMHGSGQASTVISPFLRNLLVGALAWWMLAGETLNFLAMEINGVDYSIFDWMLESTLRGRFMWSPIYGVNHFGVHQTWPMLLLVPIHAVLRFPFALCLVNVVLLTAAAVVLWQLAQRLLDDSLTAGLAVVAFLTNPWIGKLLSEGFRAESFYPIAIFLFVVTWVRGQPAFIAAAALFLCSVKEDAPFYLLGFAAAAALRPGRSRAGALGCALVASAMLSMDLLLVRPAALRSVGAVQPGYVANWSGYGTSLSGIVVSIITSPLRVLKEVVTSGWWRLLGPSLLLPLLSPECVGAMLPGIVMLGISGYPPMRAFVGYHTVPLLCAALCGLLAVGRAYRSRAWVTTGVRVALLLVPLFGGGYFRITRPARAALDGLAETRAALGSTQGPVCAQAILLPQLGYPTDLRALDADCAKLPGSLTVVNPLLDPWPFSREALETQIFAARRDGRSAEFKSGFAVLGRGPTR